jgi:hypothetical protein
MSTFKICILAQKYNLSPKDDQFLVNGTNFSLNIHLTKTLKISHYRNVISELNDLTNDLSI